MLMQPTCAYHRPPELCDELACWRGSVDRLLMEIQADTASLKALDRAAQIDERSPKPLDCQGHDNVKLSPARVLQHGIEARATVSALGSADAGQTTSQRVAG